jgi:hypothetical protein
MLARARTTRNNGLIYQSSEVFDLNSIGKSANFRIFVDMLASVAAAIAAEKAADTAAASKTAVASGTDPKINK